MDWKETLVIGGGGGGGVFQLRYISNTIFIITSLTPRIQYCIKNLFRGGALNPPLMSTHIYIYIYILTVFTGIGIPITVEPV